MKTQLFAKLTFITAFLLLVVSALSAKTDTLGYIGKYKKGDTTYSLNIMKKLTWEVCATFTDGTKDTCLISEPDSVLELDNLASLHMSATFYVDTPALHKILYLHSKLEGSMKLSVNGRNFVTTGSMNKKWAFCDPERDDYTSITFNDTLSRIDIEYLPYKTGEFSLDLALYQKHAGEEKIKEGTADNNEAFAIGFYYLAFGIVFLIIFVYFREQTENLYFSMFCIFAALAYLWGQLDTDLLYNLDPFLGIFCFEFLSIFFRKILANKEQSKRSLLVITCLMAICFLPPVRYGTSLMEGHSTSWVLVAVIAALYPYTWIKTLIVLIKGVGQKRWEARAVLVFCLVPLVLFVLTSIVVSFVFAARMNNDDNIRRSMSSAAYLGDLLGYFKTAIVFLYPLAAVVILGRRNGMNQLKLIAQVRSIRELSEENLAKEVEKKEILEAQKEVLEKEVALRTEEIMSQKGEIEKQHDELKVEKAKSDDLLRNILPQEVADELKANGTTAAKHYDNVTVLFTDFVNFTRAGERMSPQGLIDELHTCFKAFDDITARYGIEKIKTIGDAYLAVCGLPASDPDHATNMVKAAIDINAFMADRLAKMGSQRTFAIRIGIHSGSVVAGIVGVKKFAYDIWGDTVNTAARMEQHGEAGKINISQTTYELVKDKFTCEYRGEIEAKGKGVMKMYFASSAIASA